MPTPATAQYPSNPSTPWVQCPDDQQNSRRTSWQPDGPLYERNEYFDEMPSPTLEDIAEREASTTADGAVLNRTASGAILSRENSMSPQPQPRATTVPEGEIKSAFKAEMSRDASPAAEHVHEYQSPEHRNDTPSPDLPMVDVEDGYFSPSMGPYVPTVRVSLTRIRGISSLASLLTPQ
jgi:hypothetical protein